MRIRDKISWLDLIFGRQAWHDIVRNTIWHKPLFKIQFDIRQSPQYDLA